MLQKQVEYLRLKAQHPSYATESRLQQKGTEVLEWKKKYLKDMKGLIEQMDAMKEFQKETSQRSSQFDNEGLVKTEIRKLIQTPI